MVSVRHAFRYACFLTAMGASGAACNLPAFTQDACSNQADCLSGYTCTANVCIAGDGAGSPGGGVTGGSSTGGAAGAAGTGLNANAPSNANNTRSGSAGEVATTAAKFVVGCAQTQQGSGKFTKGGNASQLIFTTQPSQGMINRGLCTVEVAFADASGNVDTTQSAAVTLTLISNPANANAQMTGVMGVAATGGFATFDNLKINAAATGYVLQASGGGFTAQSAPFAVQVPAWTQLAAAPSTTRQLAGGDSSTNTFVFGDSNGNLYALPGTGLYTSRDGGVSWPEVNTTLTQASIFVDPRNANSLYGVTAAGLQHSTDGGNTFSSFATSTLYQVEGVDDTTSTLYAVSGGGEQAGIYASTDGGTTWGSPLLPLANTSPGLVFAGNSPGTLYAFYGNNVVFTTDTAHVSWQSTGRIGSGTNVIKSVAVDPQNAQVAYVASNDGLFKVTVGSSTSVTQLLYTCATQVATATTTGADSKLQTAVFSVLNDCSTNAPGTYPSPTVVTSLDAGSTWGNAAWGLNFVPPPADAQGESCGVSLVSDAASPGTLYVALGACGGVYKTLNGGL